MTTKNHNRLIDKLHKMGATKIALGSGEDRVEVEFPLRPIEFTGPLKAVKTDSYDKDPEDMTEEEVEAYELRMTLLGTEEGT